MCAGAVITTRGKDGHGHDELPSSMPPAVVTTAVDGPRRRRRRARGAVTLAKTAGLILIAGSASLILLQSGNPTAVKAKAALTARWTTFQQSQQLPASLQELQDSISKRGATLLEDVPRLGHRVLEGTKATALSVTTFTAESAEVAWEKSETAFHQLANSQDFIAEEKEEDEEQNPLERALEGIFHLRRRAEKDEGKRKGSDNKNNGKKNNNLRKDGRNKSSGNKQPQRNMKVKEGGEKQRRNAKADQAEPNTFEQPERSENQRGDWMSILSNIPMATPLLAFCALIFLAASLVMSPSQRSHNQVRENHGNNLILDEEELEIVEFYEKEMECGTLQTIPFLQQDDDDIDVAEEHSPMKRPTSCNDRYLMMNVSSERNLSDSALAVMHRRSSSDPLLTRHHHSSGGEMMRESSHGDLYYSRVLETLHYDEVDDEEDEIDTPSSDQDEGEGQIIFDKDDSASCCDQECQITLMDNMSSLTEEDEGLPDNTNCQGVLNTAQSSTSSSNPQHHVIVESEDEDDACFESAQSEHQKGEHQGKSDDDGHPQSPPSSCSSLSSLTSEGYDIEAPFESIGISSQHDPKLGNEESAAIVVPGPEQVSRSLSLNATAEEVNAEQQVSSTSATPPRSNLYQDRRTSLITRERKQQLPRRVSFSLEVEVCEIPMMQHQQRHGLSSESYLYIMLFTVAIAIAVFSLLPAHPSLSPIYTTMTGGDILSRAESMLNSQWDVEL